MFILQSIYRSLSLSFSVPLQLSIYPYIRPSIYLRASSSVFIFKTVHSLMHTINLYICVHRPVPTTYLPTYPSTHPHTYPPTHHLSIYMFFFISFFLSFYVCMYLCIYQSTYISIGFTNVYYHRTQLSSLSLSLC
jgi:hypothetical protein